MSIQIELNKDKVAEFCLRNHIRSLALFGSVLRDDFRPDSDVDVLIEFVPGQEHGLMEPVGMQDELSEILGRKVDMVERKAVEKSENYIRRRHVLDSVEHVYVARGCYHYCLKTPDLAFFFASIAKSPLFVPFVAVSCYL